VFVLLMCEELGLSPLAGLLAAGSLAASPMFMFWLTFPTFLGGWCWSAAMLYGVTRLARKEDLIGWSLLAFSAYSLLMTGYPQMAVAHGYIVGGYTLVLACRRHYATWRSMIRYLAVVSSAVAVGALLVLPIYLDLARAAADSLRIAPALSFFLDALPKIDSPTALEAFLAAHISPDFFGNPISPTNPAQSNGIFVTPLVMFLAWLCLFLRFGKTWGWWLAIAVLVAMTFVRPLFAFAVNHLGFNISRGFPLGYALLPLTIVTAYGADALVRRPQTDHHRRAIILAAAATVMVLLLGLGSGLVRGFAVRWEVAAFALVVVGVLAAQAYRFRPLLLIAVLILVGAYVSFPMMMRRPPSQLLTTSPAVDMVRANLPVDSYYAMVSSELHLLPPNFNAVLNLPSIHSYDSLSAGRYHVLIAALGGQVSTYGRWNGSIAPDYERPMFWISNIALILSRTKLTQPNLHYLGAVGEVYFHRVLSRMGESLQVILPSGSVLADGVEIADPRHLQASHPRKTSDLGDLLEFDVTDEPSTSLLILSHKFHSDWRADVLTPGGWLEGRTFPVDGVFEGVVLPEHARKVRLQFLPAARFAWVGHVFWMLIVAILVYRALRWRAVPGGAGSGSERPEQIV
jgi:hypothetical protein